VKALRWLLAVAAVVLVSIGIAGFARKRQFTAVEWGSCGRRHHVPCVVEKSGQQESSLAYLRSRDELFFIGDIGPGFDEAIGSALRRFPDARTLSIAWSRGGLQASALRAARDLNRHGMAVRIDGRCASACATLWASSKARQAHPKAMLGLHDGILAKDVPAWLRDRIARSARTRTADALRGAGFPEREIQRGAHTPNTSIHWLDVPALQRAGVKFELVEPDHVRRRESDPPPVPRS
jgi:hypothetical protein